RGEEGRRHPARQDPRLDQGPVMRAAWLVALLVACARTPPGLVAPTAAEMAEARAWADANWGPGAAKPPISFSYGATPLDHWATSSTTRRLDANREQRTRAFTDPATGLAVTAD